jgi:hypothetical protein
MSDKYLIVPRASTYTKALAIADGAGAVIDLSGDPTLIFTVRKEQDLLNAPQIKLTIGSGITITGATTGLVDVKITSAQTLGLTLGTYLWEMKYINDDVSEELITNSGLLFLTSHLMSGIS